MEFPADIQRYNYLIYEDQVYIFLDGLDDKLDNIYSDMLQLHMLPITEKTYAHFRREAFWEMVMNSSDHEPVTSLKEVVFLKCLKPGTSRSTP